MSFFHATGFCRISLALLNILLNKCDYFRMCVCALGGVSTEVCNYMEAICILCLCHAAAAVKLFSGVFFPLPIA